MCRYVTTYMTTAAFTPGHDHKCVAALNTSAASEDSVSSRPFLPTLDFPRLMLVFNTSQLRPVKAAARPHKVLWI